MKEKCYYHYIIKDTIKPPLSQERWEVFSLFFKKSPPKEQAFVRLSHPDRGKGPAHRTPGRGRPWTPPFPGKRERAPALSLLPPWVLVRLSSSLGRLLKGIHPPFRPIAWPGKAAGPGGSRKKTQRAPHTFPPQPTRPAGHASQSSAGRSRRKRIKSCFDRLRRPKHTSQPPVCPQGARSGCNPPILGGASHQADYLTPPYSTAPNEAQTSLSPPKILTVRRSASPPDPPASAAPPQPGGSGPGSGPGSRWPSGPGGRRGPRCWSFSRSSPGPLGWTGWS